MGYLKVWIHAVWTTKNCEPFLRRGIGNTIFEHIIMNAEKNRILIDCVNGYENHVHCLFSLKSTQTIGEVVNILKGESSHWINTNRLISEHFYWQKDYYAASVGWHSLPRVRNYIANQEKRHSRLSLEDEIDSL